MPVEITKSYFITLAHLLACKRIETSSEAVLDGVHSLQMLQRCDIHLASTISATATAFLKQTI
jgi:hypothetical protein